MRSDAVGLFIGSFIGGLFVSTTLLLLVDPPTYVWTGTGCICTAAIAAWLYRRQQDRRY
jgi:hypothetical protein